MSESHEPNPYRSPTPAEAAEHRKWFLVFWGTLIVAIGSALVVIPFYPGVAIGLAIVATPGFLRAYVKLQRETKAKGMPDLASQTGLVAVSLLLVGLMVLAALIAGMVVCTATGFFGLAVGLMDLHSPTTDPASGVRWDFVALGLGGLAAIGFFVWSFSMSLGYNVFRQTSPGEMSPIEDAPRDEQPE